MAVLELLPTPGLDMTEAEEMARRVRAARAYAGITQEDMGNRLGVSVVTYKRIEAGRRELTLDEVRRVSEITQLPLDFFTEEIRSLSAGRENKEQLDTVRDQIADLVERLGDIEWRIRRNIDRDENAG